MGQVLAAALCALLVVLLGACSGDVAPVVIRATPVARVTATPSQMPAPSTASPAPGSSTPTPDTVPAPTPRPRPTAPRPDLPATCAPIVLVGARGSGQVSGVGQEIDRLAETVMATSATTVDLIAVDYPASPFGGPLADAEFGASVRVGAQAIVRQTLEVTRRCPDAEVVWAGFSQGALVARTAMAQYLDPSVLDVAAVVLLADPTRAPDDPANHGPLPVDVGAPLGDLGVPTAWTTRTSSWCLVDDPVCDSGAGDLIRGLVLHARGYADASLAEPVAAWVDDVLDAAS